MADKAHDGLTGAYYGPPVPPRHTSHSVGRGSDCCCCLPCCLLSTLFKIIFAILVFIAIIAVVVWFVFRPNRLVVYAEDATLSQFELTTDGRSLAYNLSLDLSIRNPNRRIALYYDRLEGAASYDGYRFGYDYEIPTFFQDHKNTSLIRTGFSGQQALVVGSVADRLRKDKGDGWFDIQVKLYTKVRLKVWAIKTNKYSPDFTCDLRFPAPTPNGAADGFSRTKCSVAYF